MAKNSVPRASAPPRDVAGPPPAPVSAPSRAAAVLAQEAAQRAADTYQAWPRTCYKKMPVGPKTPNGYLARHVLDEEEFHRLGPDWSLTPPKDASKPKPKPADDDDA